MNATQSSGFRGKPSAVHSFDQCAGGIDDNAMASQRSRVAFHARIFQPILSAGNWQSMSQMLNGIGMDTLIHCLTGRGVVKSGGMC